MSANSEYSRLLTLLDASTDPDPHASAARIDAADQVSATLQQQIRQYALAMLQDDFPDDERHRAEDQLVQGLAREPQGLWLLRTALNRAAEVDALGPVPAALIERQKRRLLGWASPTPANFTVVLSRSGLRYAGPRQWQIQTSVEMARDSMEKPRLVKLRQRLNRCELMLQIEPGVRRTFLLVVSLTYVDPVCRNQQLSALVSEESQSLQRTETFSSDGLEFENLPAGHYSLQILADGQVIDELVIELQVESDL